MRLVLAPSVRDAIAAARVTRAPEEACGLLFGRLVADGTVMAGRFIECENVLHSPSAFEIDPAEQYTRIKENKDLSLVGIVHTHPGHQFVSATDERFMLGTSKVSSACWVIAGSARDNDGMEIGAYRVHDGKIVAVRIVDASTGKTF